MSNKSEFLESIVRTYLGNSPELLACLLGLALALINWRKYPRPSLLLLLGVLVEGLNIAVVYPVLYDWLAPKFLESGSTGDIDRVYLVVNGFTSVFSAVALGLIFAAVFAGRNTPRLVPRHPAEADIRPGPADEGIRENPFRL